MAHVRSDDHVLGPSTVSVTLIAYCDFECPYCRRAAPAIKRLLASYGDDLRFVYRHFPLVNKHPAAFRAAEAAEAAGEQGQFWEMHDVLFQNQDELEFDDLLAYADTLGLDLDVFEDALVSHRHITRIRRDMESGLAAGVRGTPAFYVNGKHYDDEQELDDAMELAVEEVNKGG